MRNSRLLVSFGIVLLLWIVISCTSYAPGESPSDLIMNKSWHVVSGVFGGSHLQPDQFNTIKITKNKWVETDSKGNLSLTGEITKFTDNKITVSWIETPGFDFLKGQHTPYYYKIKSNKLFLTLYREGKVFGHVTCELVE